MKCVIRVMKIKTPAGVRHVLNHNTRAVKVDRAIAEREPRNFYFSETDAAGKPIPLDRKENLSDRFFNKFKAIIEPLRKRSDSVHALDYVIGIPKEAKEVWTQNQKLNLLAKSIRWVEKRHGKEAVIGAFVHDDEHGLHVHVDVVPIGVVRDKHGHSYDSLSARPWMGTRGILRQLQTDYHKDVGRAFGLERGTMGSQATHEQPDDFWRRVAEGKDRDRQLNAIRRLSVTKDIVAAVEKKLDKGYSIGD
jgi:hypothetical protein